jgi:hypothetical protein
MGFIPSREIGENYAFHTYSGNMKETGYVGDLGIDWRMILKLMLKKQDGNCVDCVRLAPRGSSVNTDEVIAAVRI